MVRLIPFAGMPALGSFPENDQRRSSLAGLPFEAAYFHGVRPGVYSVGLGREFGPLDSAGPSLAILSATGMVQFPCNEEFTVGMIGKNLEFALDQAFAWILANKTWLFSGIGVVALGFILRFFFMRKGETPQTITFGDGNEGAQFVGDGNRVKVKKKKSG